MGDTGDDGQSRPRIARVRRALPVVPVESREDMAVMLARHGRFLRDCARHYLTESDEDAVEDAVERTVAWLLDIPKPSFSNGLRYATRALWRECHRTERRRRKGGVPVDRLLGPLTGEKLRAVERLGARSRDAVMQAAQGRTSAEIARSQNTSAVAVRIRLYHARKRVEQFLAEGRLTVSGVALIVQRETRGPRHRAVAWCQRRVPAMSWPSVDPLVQIAAVTVVAVSGLGIADSVSVPTSTSGPVASQSAPVEAGPSHPGVAPLAGQVAPAGRDEAPSGTAAASTAPHFTADALPGLVGGRLPGSETPEDAQLITAAPAPNYSSTHTIVALGQGKSCGCGVLFQSTDGGATWTASSVPAPPGAQQVALPPEYPRDPRVFIGTDPGSGGTIYVAARFGDTAMSLPGPPGHLALAAGFDHGDNRVFIAARQAVVSLSVDATPPQLVPLLTYPQWPSTASLATPTGVEGAAVLILAPPGTVAVSDLLSGETPSTAVFICGSGTTCSRRGAPPSQAAVLTASPSDPLTAVSWGHGVSVSQDGGQTFQSPTIPTSVVGVASVAAAGGRVWAVMQNGTTVAVMWASAAGGSWKDVTVTDPMLGHSLALVAVPQGPVLDLLSTGGLRCTADGGTTWASRCP